MSPAAQLPDPTPLPQPPRDTTPTPIPAALGRVLGVLRKLIDYGKDLVAAVRQHAGAPGFDRIVYPFGTLDVAIILTRITNGLRRAAALEAALLRRAASGRDLTPSPIRLPSVRTPRPARQVAAPEAAQPADATELPHLLTEAEIAAEVRRRPVGTVIADICRDLGIAPGELDRAFWDELCLAITAYGGNTATLLRDLMRRLSVWMLNPPTAEQRIVPRPAPPPALALATGPP